MELKMVTGDSSIQQVDAIVVNLFQGVTHSGGATGVAVRTLVQLTQMLVGEQRTPSF